MGDGVLCLNHPIQVMTVHPGTVYNVVMINDDIKPHKKRDEGRPYQIKILGEIEGMRNAWFTEIGFVPTMEKAEMTTLTGMIKDQAHLRGILNRIWDLNFTVVLVKRVDKTGETNDE